MKQSDYLFFKSADDVRHVKVIVQAIKPFLGNIQNYMDIGCGMCEWSNALYDIGITDGLLIDHPLSPIGKKQLNNGWTFMPVDLDSDLPMVEKKDLIICTEVLEHFREDAAKRIASFINENTDFILFSAAIPGQGGVGHYNEQRHQYWHNIFKNFGFQCFDGFKHEFIHNRDIPFYYRQNLFLYHRGIYSERFKDQRNYTPVDMELVSYKILNAPLTLKQIAYGIIPAIKRFLFILPSRIFKK